MMRILAGEGNTGVSLCVVHVRLIFIPGMKNYMKFSQSLWSLSLIHICTSESYELLTDILRGEWGFQGMVTTDWWTCGEHYKEIKAGNDLKMATGYPERVKKAMEMGLLLSLIHIYNSFLAL